MQKTSARPLVFFVAFLALAAVGVFFVAARGSAAAFQVTFLDIGQGDAILLRTPAGQDVLIDGGPDASVLDGLGKHLPFLDRDIELMILTHPDADHMQGQIDIFDRYVVKRVMMNGATSATQSFAAWQERLKKEHAPSFTACRGTSVTLDRGVQLEVQSPPCTLRGDEASNERSLLFTVTYGATVFLFTGDAPVSAERAALPFLGDVDVLKVGHHGSKTSTSEEFLEKTKPEIAVISAGRENRYGHPHRSVLERLERFWARMFRTDQEGDVRCRSDGQNVSCRAVRA